MKFIFAYKNKEMDIEVKECKSVFSKMLGLMFRMKSKPLLFLFNREVNEPIHSFFCVPFVVIWFKKNKIIDVKLVKPWRPYILPKESFDKFLEVPINNKTYNILIDLFNLLSD